jgi:hypothetical protein
MHSLTFTFSALPAGAGKTVFWYVNLSTFSGNLSREIGQFVDYPGYQL